MEMEMEELTEKLIDLGLTLEDVDEVACKEKTEAADVEKLLKKGERVTNPLIFMRTVIDIVKKVRSIKDEFNIPQTTLVVLSTTDYHFYIKLVKSGIMKNFCRMAGLSDFTLQKQDTKNG